MGMECGTLGVFGEAESMANFGVSLDFFCTVCKVGIHTVWTGFTLG